MAVNGPTQLWVLSDAPLGTEVSRKIKFIHILVYLCNNLEKLCSKFF